MLKFYVDYNSREILPDGAQSIAIRLDARLNSGVGDEQLQEGLHVLLYDEETGCEGVLRKAVLGNRWMADIVPGTVKHLPEGQRDRLKQIDSAA